MERSGGVIDPLRFLLHAYEKRDGRVKWSAYRDKCICTLGVVENPSPPRDDNETRWYYVMG